MNQTQSPYQIFLDNNGKALEDGYIYIGTANLNPETTPVGVYYDVAGTQLAAQPLRTSGGYIWSNGSPARVYISASTYAITVKDKNGVLLSTTASVDTVFNGSNVINQTATGFVYTSAGAHINRLNDRTFTGAASINDGNTWSATPGAGGNQDYVTAALAVPCLSTAQLAALSTTGGIGVVGGTRASDSAGAQSQTTLGLVGISLNDYAGTPKVIAEGAYMEAQRSASAGITQGVEIAIVNKGSVETFTPYTPFSSADIGYTIGQSIESGGGRAGAVNASVALAIYTNGASFGKGILFASAAMDANNEAISFGVNHAMRWWNSSFDVFGTVGQSTITSKIVTFTAAAVVPVAGQYVTFSDGTSSFPANTYITSVDSATQIKVSAAATATTAGLTLSGTFAHKSSYIQGQATNTNQDTIVFANNGVLLGASPATNSGANSAGGLLVGTVAGATRYAVITPSVAGAPKLSTGAGDLVVTSTTGIVNFGDTSNYVRTNNSATNPVITTNGSSLLISSATGGVKIGNTEAVPTLLLGVAQASINSALATPAGGTTSSGLVFGTANIGIYFGSGAPTLSAVQGSLYLRTDGSSTTTRAYIATNSAGTWTSITTAA